MDTKTTDTQTIPRKNTSLNVREDLWDGLKIRAIRKKMTITEAVEAAIDEWLNSGATGAQPREIDAA